MSNSPYTVYVMTKICNRKKSYCSHNNGKYFLVRIGFSEIPLVDCLIYRAGDPGLYINAGGMGVRMKSETNYIYIVKCADQTLYTGWTTCIERRLAEHNSGKGAKYTKSRRPVELVYYESFETKQQAMSREANIKRLTRKGKEALIRQGKIN